MSSPDDQAWRVPQVVADDKYQVSRYYLSRAGMELARGLDAARTDPERELFGPDGDKFKELLGDEDTYAELVGNLREAAEITKPALTDLRTVGNIPMRTRLDYECRAWVIGDKQGLAAKNEAAKALRTAAEEFTEYRRRLWRAETLAAGSTLAAELAKHRRLLEDTFRGDEDQVAWWEDALTKLEARLDLHTADLNLTAGPARGARAPTDPPPLLPEPEPLEGAPETAYEVAGPPWDAKRGSLRGGRLTYGNGLSAR